MVDRRLPSHQPRHVFVAMFVALALAAALFPAVVSAAEYPPGLAKKLAHPHARDRVIVSYQPGASRAKRAKSVRTVDVASVQRISARAKDTVVVELQPGQTVANAIVEISARAGVAYVEPDYRLYPAATSNDPEYTNGNLWGMHGDGTSSPNGFGTGAGEAWARGFTGSQDVYVAVIDQGVQITHPDLAPNIWTNPGEIPDNGIDDDGNGFADDVNGWDFKHGNASVYDSAAEDWHGTHVAGTIGARGGNGMGVTGVDWSVTIIPVKFMDHDGGSVLDAVKAIDYVTDLKRRGVNVVATNNSWGGGGFSQALNDAIDAAGDAGILFVAAAGNGTQDIDEDPAYPAALQCDNGGARGWDCLISVANLTSGGALASSSNWGDQNVDLGAPGSWIISTSPVSSYEYLSGTSMAAPHVTGAVALCASIEPSLSASQIRSRIMASATPTNSMVGRTVTGDRLDIGALVDACGRTIPAIVGLTAAAADQAITNAGLAKGSVGSGFSATIPAGQVIHQAPAAGTPAALGAPVGYDLSLGVEPAVAPASVVVDERSSWFVRRGAGWKRAIGGYKNRYLWARTRAGSAARSGRWRPVLPVAGDYRIEVKIPPRHATTRKAIYKVRTTSGWVKRVRNQHKSRGRWISLGVHRLTTRPVVLLTDRTGERSSLRRRIGFDAVRFIPLVPGAASTAVVTPSSDGAVKPAAQPSPMPTPAPTDDPTAQPAIDPDGTPEPTVAAARASSQPETGRSEPAAERTPEPAAERTAAPASEPKSEPKPATQPSRQVDPSVVPRKEPTAERDSRSAEWPTPKDERPNPAKRRPDPPESRPEATEPPQKPAIEKRASAPRRARSSRAPADATAPSGPELVLVIDPERLVLTVGETRPIAAYACPRGAADPGADEKYGTADDGCSIRENVEWSLKDPDVADVVEAHGKRTRLSATRAIAATKVMAKAGDLTARGELKIKQAAAPEPAPTVENPASQPRPEADPAAKADPRPSAGHPVKLESRPRAGTSGLGREPVSQSKAEPPPSVEPTPEPTAGTGEPTG